MAAIRRFRKKPVVIEAYQWFGHDSLKTEDATVRYFRDPGTPGDSACKKCAVSHHDHGWIDTLEGGHIVCPGDWVIKGVAGEFYPCKPDIFEATYEEVTADGGTQ